MSVSFEIFSNTNWILNFVVIFVVYFAVRSLFHKTLVSAICLSVCGMVLGTVILVAWRNKVLEEVYVENVIIACFTAVVSVTHFVMERRKAAK